MKRRSDIKYLLSYITITMFNCVGPIYPEGPYTLRNLAKKKEP